MDAHNARAVLHMLQLATEAGGTAPKAQTMGYSVGGKTGTARKQEGKGYADKKYRGFFVGVAPIDNPRLVVAVMIDDPSNGKYYGGDVAAPVFSETVQQSLRMLGVQPDMAVRPMVVTDAVEESF
jgi:cell division protein FtsI (penicillin-binding protein 3)